MTTPLALNGDEVAVGEPGRVATAATAVPAAPADAALVPLAAFIGEESSDASVTQRCCDADSASALALSAAAVEASCADRADESLGQQRARSGGSGTAVSTDCDGHPPICPVVCAYVHPLTS